MMLAFCYTPRSVAGCALDFGHGWQPVDPAQSLQVAPPGDGWLLPPRQRRARAVLRRPYPAVHPPARADLNTDAPVTENHCRRHAKDGSGRFGARRAMSREGPHIL